jgi:hypothetical protein
LISDCDQRDKTHVTFIKHISAGERHPERCGN